MEYRSQYGAPRGGGYSSSRGGYRGGSQVGSRGGSHGNSWQRNTPRYYQKPPEVLVIPRPAFGPLIRSIIVADIDVEEDQPAVITDCELVGSFSWLDCKEPSILIPGGPPRWSPLARSTALTSDSGAYFRDINSARLPLHPMEPVAHAVCTSQNGQEMKSTTGGNLDFDIVACGYTFGNLLRFIRLDELEPGACKSFRLVAHLIGKDDEDKGKKATLFLVRRENAPDECIQGVTGFGHTFCESYTKWDGEKCASHQRILKYRFGGLNILFRSEADGYMKDKVPSSASTDALRPIAEKTGIDEIDDLFSSLGMGTGPASSSADKAPVSKDRIGSEDGLQVRFGGELLPQQAIFDIKTRSIWKKDQRDEMLEQEMPRLWCRQMPTFILAFHRRGVFAKEDIEVIDVRRKAKKWEQDHQESLQKLAGLLRMIVEEVKSLPRGAKLEICYTAGEDNDECLEFREPGPGAMDALSRKGQQIWTGQSSDEDGVESDGEDEDDEGGACSYTNKRYDDDDNWSEPDLDDLDFTACSSSDCGYCGKCPY